MKKLKMRRPGPVSKGSRTKSKPGGVPISSPGPRNRKRGGFNVDLGQRNVSK